MQMGCSFVPKHIKTAYRWAQSVFLNFQPLPKPSKLAKITRSGVKTLLLQKGIHHSKQQDVKKNLRGTFSGFFFSTFQFISSVTLYNQFLFVGNVVHYIGHKSILESHRESERAQQTKCRQPINNKRVEERVQKKGKPPPFQVAVKFLLRSNFCFGQIF